MDGSQGIKKIVAKARHMEKDGKGRKGEMGPLTTNTHLLLPIPVALPSSFRAPTVPMPNLLYFQHGGTRLRCGMGSQWAWLDEQADLKG